MKPGPRPELDKLRELVRTEAIDVLICYSLDRLTRDPGHGVIITQELEKNGVKLEAVTEDVDNSELGKLIAYIKGYAAKLEAEKIRERTVRGKRAVAKAGRIVGGNGAGLYGYDYVKGEGRRVINEAEASWVRQMFDWLVNEGLSTNAICYRLRDRNAPTKSGKTWNRASALRILKNEAYAGQTYAFTALGGKLYGKLKEDWIEVPGVTPAIISQELFDAAQRQLRINSDRSNRNRRHEYLLRGHLRCRRCERAYVGSATPVKQGSARYYRCIGRLRTNAPVDRCHNKMWRADRLEGMVWVELTRYLSDRDPILQELEAQRQDAGQLSVFEAELERVERQIKSLDREQHQLLQWALKDFPADQVETENKRLNKAKETLKAQKTELEAQLKASQDALINVPQLEGFIRDMQDKLPNLDFEGKRLALDMLNIAVYLDGQNVEVTGIIEPECCIATTSSE